MKQITTLLFAALITLSACTSKQKEITDVPPPPVEGKWELVQALSDEFNDGFDRKKWMLSLWNYGEPVYMVAENSGVADGKLWIKATLRDDSVRWFQTSRVMSRKRISYPMYMECRMIANDVSSFNTFWLNNGDSYNRDEIDMCESNAKPSLDSMAHYAHTLNSQYFIVKDSVTKREHGNFDNNLLSENNPMRGKRWSEQYHIVGIHWIDERNIQFYLNGEKAGSVVTEKDFTRKLHVIWDVWTSYDYWTGGIASKEDLKNDSINTMYVDWIHTYKPVE